MLELLEVAVETAKDNAGVVLAPARHFDELEAMGTLTRWSRMRAEPI